MTEQPAPSFTKTPLEEAMIGVARIDNLSLAYDMARKENARFCAERGLHLICRDHNGTRQSMDLDPEQPVLVNDDTLCFATGYEEDGQYEVFLGSVFGPRLYVKKVRAMATANYKHLRALVTADSLADQLLRIASQSEDVSERRRFRALSSQADAILTELMKDKR